MVNITTTLSNFKRFSLIGHDDKLLSAEAIQEPGEHLFGAKADQMERLTPIFTPTAAILDVIKAILAEHKPQPAGYPVPGLAAILLKKGNMDFEAADLSAANLRPLFADFGLSVESSEALRREVQHGNNTVC